MMLVSLVTSGWRSARSVEKPDIARGPVRERRATAVERPAGGAQPGGGGGPQHGRGEGDPGGRGDGGDSWMHRRVAQRLPDPPAEEVDEHVVGVKLAVLGVHVLRIQA